MTTCWEEIFRQTPVPRWLRDFDHDPDAAVDAALKGEYYFGALNSADPADLLIDWALGLSQQLNFVPRLDKALANWIEQNWGHADATDKGSRTLHALAWIGLSQIVANVDALKLAPRALRERFDQRDTFLKPLCEGPSRDPMGMYLHAIARHQEDDSLSEVWWNHCKLASGVPWYHGIYGIAGLRGLPPSSERERGAFPERVAKGLALLGIALYRCSQDDILDIDRAHEEFNNVAHLTFVAYPFLERWQECWRKEIASGAVPAAVIDWMVAFVPALNVPESDPEFLSSKPIVTAEEMQLLEDVLSQLANPKPYAPKAILEITGIGGIGKTALLRLFNEKCKARPNFHHALVDCQNFGIDVNAFVREIVRQIGVADTISDAILASSSEAMPSVDLTVMLITYLKSLLNKPGQQHCLVLIFDSVDQSDVTLKKWLLEVMDSTATWERTLFAIAHDVPLASAEHSRLKNRAFSHGLQEFDLTRTQQQLQYLDVPFTSAAGSKEWADALHTVTQGHPFANRVIATVARQRQYQPFDLRTNQNSLNEIVYQEVLEAKVFRKIRLEEKERILQILMPLSIPRMFNLLSMAQLIDHFAPRHRLPYSWHYTAMINELHYERGFVRYSRAEGAYVVVPSLRGALFTKLKNSRAEVFRSINEFLAGMYREWNKQGRGFERTRYFLEQIYHLAQLERSTQKLLAKFNDFAEQSSQEIDRSLRQHLKQQFIEHFESDPDLTRLFNAETRQSIYKLFS
jgi:hypothetical protein